MKQSFLKGTLVIALCVCMAGTLLATIPPTGVAHAATRNLTLPKQPHVPMRSIIPNHQIGVGQSNVGPSVTAACGNPLFTGSSDTFFAYLGTDHHINLVDVNRNTSYVTSQTSNFTPQISCWHNNLAVDWVATDGSNAIVTGLFLCNQIFGCNAGGVDIFDTNKWSQATTDEAPAFTSNGDTMYIGWVGLDNQHHLNMLALADTLHTASGVTTFSDFTQDGAGLCLYFDGGNGQIYVSFIDAGASQRIHLGIYNPNNPSQLTAAAGSPFNDSSPEAAGIFANNGSIDFIWRGSGGNNHIWTDFWDGSWHGHISQSDTTFWAPSIDGFGTPPNATTFTTFTGTNNVVYFDTSLYNF